MTMAVTDNAKELKRKSSNGSVNSEKRLEGYGKSPVVGKPKLSAMPGLVESFDLSASARGKRRTTSIQAPLSAPARDRSMGALPEGLAPAPDLNEDSGSPSSTAKPKMPKKRSMAKSTTEVLSDSAPDLNEDAGSPSSTTKPKMPKKKSMAKSTTEVLSESAPDLNEDAGSPNSTTKPKMPKKKSMAKSTTEVLSESAPDLKEQAESSTGTAKPKMPKKKPSMKLTSGVSSKDFDASISIDMAFAPNLALDSSDDDVELETPDSFDVHQIASPTESEETGSVDAEMKNSSAYNNSRSFSSMNGSGNQLASSLTSMSNSVILESIPEKVKKMKKPAKQTSRASSAGSHSTTPPPGNKRTSSNGSSVNSSVHKGTRTGRSVTPPPPTDSRAPTTRSVTPPRRAISGSSAHSPPPTPTTKRSASMGSFPPPLTKQPRASSAGPAPYSPGKHKAGMMTKEASRAVDVGVSPRVGQKKHVPRLVDGAPSSPGRLKPNMAKATSRSVNLGLSPKTGPKKPISLANFPPPPMSPGKSKMQLVLKSSRSMSPPPSQRNFQRAPSKSPGRQYKKSVSDASGSRSLRESRMVDNRGDSILSLDADAPSGAKKPVKKHLPQAPLTWHDNRDSRKLNSSNLRQKIGGNMAMVPILDDESQHSAIPRGSQHGSRSPIPRASQRGANGGPIVARKSNSFGNSSHHRDRSLDISRRSTQRNASEMPKRSSSHPPRASSASQSTHIPRTSNHIKPRQLSQSAHGVKTPIPRESVRSKAPGKPSSDKSLKKGSVIGSVVGMVDRVLGAAVSVPAEKYGTDAKGDDSSTDSFANDDIEAGKKKRPSFKKKTSDKKKKKEAEEASKKKPHSTNALKVLEANFGIEKKPPKTLVVIWMLIMAELTFDFVTTVISFMVFARGSYCCGYEIDVGNVPVAITVPFFFLVLLESFLLFSAILITMWPSIMADDDGDQEHNFIVRWGKRLRCCFKWNPKVQLYALSISVILNPFFGCIIAWMLLYQSSKFESFLVLGLEGFSIVLHFISVYLEGSCKTCKEFCFHCIQLVPFLTSVTLILLYLRQGGVCYLVNEGKFKFTGCELCPDGTVPQDGVCFLPDGTNITVTQQRVWEVQGDVNDLGSALIARTPQGKWCAAEHPDGPQDLNFCFFTY